MQNRSQSSMLRIRLHLDLSCSFMKEHIEERTKAFGLEGIGVDLTKITKQVRAYCRLTQIAGDALCEVGDDEAKEILQQIRDCRSLSLAEVDSVSAAWVSEPLSEDQDEVEQSMPDSPDGIKRFYPDGRTPPQIAQDLGAAVAHAIELLHRTLTAHPTLLDEKYLKWAKEAGLPEPAKPEAA